MKSQFSEKNMALPIGTSHWHFPFIVPRNAIVLQHLIIQFTLHFLSSGHLWKVKNKENFKLLALLMKSGCSCLQKVVLYISSGKYWLGNFWVFGKHGHSEMVAYEMWWQPEVWLVFDQTNCLQIIKSKCVLIETLLLEFNYTG